MVWNWNLVKWCCRLCGLDKLGGGGCGWRLVLFFFIGVVSWKYGWLWVVGLFLDVLVVVIWSDWYV